jgi:hypothetical protein
MPIYYAGIGSRETPTFILEDMTEIARYLVAKNYVLRSGNAIGADLAFHEGCKIEDGDAEIFLPWFGYNKDKNDSDIALTQPTPESMEMAQQYHPAWGKCSAGAKKLHARNCHIVLGDNLETPVKFVVCYTKNGEGGGGTGQALRIAQAHNIKIFDLGIKEIRKNIMDKVNPEGFWPMDR